MIYYSDVSLPPVHSSNSASINIPGAPTEEEANGDKFQELCLEMKELYPDYTNYFSERLNRYLTFVEVAELDAEPDLNEIGLYEYSQMQEKVAELERQLSEAQRPVIQQSGGGLVLGGILGYAIAKEKYCPHCGHDIS